MFHEINQTLNKPSINLWTDQSLSKNILWVNLDGPIINE